MVTLSIGDAAFIAVHVPLDLHRRPPERAGPTCSLSVSRLVCSPRCRRWRRWEVCCAGSRSLARVPPATDGRGHTVGMGETRDVLSLFRDALGILPPEGRERLRGRAPGVCALRPLGETGPVRGLWWMASPSPRLACDAAWMTRLPRTTARPSIGFSIVFILCAFTGSDAGCK